MAKFTLICLIALLVCLVIVDVAAQGPTDQNGKPCPPCETALIYDPVCGSNGDTYSNKYEFHCHKDCLKSSKLSVKHQGECQ